MVRLEQGIDRALAAVGGVRPGAVTNAPGAVSSCMTLTRAIGDQPLAVTLDTSRAWNLYTPTDDRIGWPLRSHTQGQLRATTRHRQDTERSQTLRQTHAAL